MAFSGTGSSTKPKRRGKAEEKIRQKLAGWFLRQGRDLPWRRTQDPYAILVSEFMLQQTTVVAVIPYFERWMRAFPTVAALAAASEQDVLGHWQGLGYYSRARNLQRAAQAVMERHGGRVPRSVDALRGLPGVGDYTAGAVAAFAFDAAVPVVDANIARVLARLKNWREPIDDSAGKTFLEEAAVSLLPESGGRLHTSALMELGALVCVARNPRCLECPVRADCRAEGPEALPVKRARKATEEVVETRAFIWARGKIWLQLSAGPRWKGLWLLPPAEPPARPPDHVEVYPITRYRVTMRVFAETVPRAGLQAFPPEELPPMPSPHRRAVAAVLAGKTAN
jgi:A/G-specific adenine glycosylase